MPNRRESVCKHVGERDGHDQHAPGLRHGLDEDAKVHRPGAGRSHAEDDRLPARRGGAGQRVGEGGRLAIVLTVPELLRNDHHAGRVTKLTERAGGHLGHARRVGRALQAGELLVRRELERDLQPGVERAAGRPAAARTSAASRRSPLPRPAGPRPPDPAGRAAGACAASRPTPAAGGWCSPRRAPSG